jgi:hypothetical protein
MKYHEQEQDQLFEKCIAFINEVGINIEFKELGNDSFLPGFNIENGKIIIDRSMIQHPGDILHEAGHIAVVSSNDRPRLTEAAIIKRKNREIEEVMAIAWSYAACIHLDIDPAYVFHESGYRGGSETIMDSCQKNEYMGLFMLQSLGMARENKQPAAVPGMLKWLRQ